MNVRPKNLARLGCITSCPNHRPNRAVQVLVAMFVAVICTGLLCPPVMADIPMSKYIVLHFEQDGRPYDKPVGVYLATSAVLDVSAVPPSSNPAPDPFYIGSSRTYEGRFLLALFFTLLIEVPILLAMVRYAFGLRTIGWLKPLITGVLASALTLPYLWFVAPTVFGAPYALIIGEILVFLVEAGIYAFVLKISIRRALLISFVANLASLALGPVLF